MNHYRRPRQSLTCRLGAETRGRRPASSSWPPGHVVLIGLSALGQPTRAACCCGRAASWGAAAAADLRSAGAHVSPARRIEAAVCAITSAQKRLIDGWPVST